MEGRDKGMNKIDVAKWSLGDLSGCENLGRDGPVRGRSHAGMLDGRLNRLIELRSVDGENFPDCYVMLI